MKFIKKILSQKNAFTLLELIVVIGIIGILVALGASSYSTVQKKSRDAKRKGDLKAIQNAFEQYYSICGNTYPTPGNGAAGASVAGVDTTGVSNCSSAAVILKAVSDPTGGSYVCAGGCTASTYKICPPTTVNAKRLETEDCSDAAGASCCVTNLQ
jgi:prepilin-type N-terminal cleavage/methylation domain-containing protein